MKTLQRASSIAPKYDRHCLRLSKEEIAEKLAAGVPHVIRQRIPDEGTVTFHDEIRGDITVECATLDDQVLVKADGMPTYNFANVVDDHLMGITTVVRGTEYLSSAPKYNLLYQAFGWEIPKYLHCPPVRKDATQKLAKRNGDASYCLLYTSGHVPVKYRGVQKPLHRLRPGVPGPLGPFSEQYPRLLPADARQKMRGEFLLPRQQLPAEHPAEETDRLEHPRIAQEVVPPGDDAGDSVPAQALFQQVRLTVGAVEHRDFGKAPCPLAPARSLTV